MALFIVHADYSEAENRCKPSTVASDPNADASRDIELSRFFPLRFPVGLEKNFRKSKQTTSMFAWKTDIICLFFISFEYGWMDRAETVGFYTAEEPFLLSPNIANNGFLYSYNNPPEYSEFIDRK